MALIGPSFGEELATAGWSGLPFSWSKDELGPLDRLTKAERDGVNAVLAAHNPNTKPTNDPETAKTELRSATTIAQLRTALVKLLA